LKLALAESYTCQRDSPLLSKHWNNDWPSLDHHKPIGLGDVHDPVCQGGWQIPMGQIKNRIFDIAREHGIEFIEANQDRTAC
jgi:hypothetical protein